MIVEFNFTWTKPTLYPQLSNGLIMKMKTFYGGLILKNAEIQDFLVLDEFIGEQLKILNILKLSLIFTNQNASLYPSFTLLQTVINFNVEILISHRKLAFSYQKDGDFLF